MENEAVHSLPHQLSLIVAVLAGILAGVGTEKIQLKRSRHE